MAGLLKNRPLRTGDVVFFVQLRSGRIETYAATFAVTQGGDLVFLGSLCNELRRIPRGEWIGCGQRTLHQPH